MSIPSETLHAGGTSAEREPEAVSATPVPAAEDDATVLHSPFRLRNSSLLVMAVLMCLAALRFASDIFVPIVVGVLFSYALAPWVALLVRLHVPRYLASAVLLLGILGGTGGVIYALSDDAVALIETLPKVVQNLRRSMEHQHTNGPAGTIDKVQKVASEIERTTEEDNSALEPARDVAKVQIERPKVNVKDYLVPGTLGLASFFGKCVVVLFITFFLLAAGNNFRRKMVKLAGPTLTQKKLTLHALDEIDAQIQRYLQVQLFTSALVGLGIWLAFLWIGVEHAAVWGIVTFVLNFIPYLGAIVATSAAAVMGFSQFGTFEMALLTGGAVLLINSLEGYVLTPWLTSRATRMNPVAVFIGVLAWGWLWGIWGLFLGVPILMVIKVVCDRVDDFKAVGELLGE